MGGEMDKTRTRMMDSARGLLMEGRGVGGLGVFSVSLPEYLSQVLSQSNYSVTNFSETGIKEMSSNVQ